MLRRLLITLIVASGLVTVAAPTTQPVHADRGLAIESRTTYTLDGASGRVRVAVDLTLTNTIPDRTDGGTIIREYFTAFHLPAPATSANIAAIRSDGRRLTVTAKAVPDEPDVVIYALDLGERLFYPSATRLTVSYDITGSPPRSPNPWRVNPAYASFDGFGIGDDGKVTVRVVVPIGFVVDVLGSTTVVSQENGNVVYTASDIPNPSDFDILVSARNDAALVSTQVATADNRQFVLRSWPGDAEWATFVTNQIHLGVPQLAKLIGQPWPIDGPLDVLQASTPYLYGYAGWFSASKKRIEIGENLDQEVVLHELSHAWFSDSWFVDRWLDEGLAQVYSNKTIDSLGGTGKVPTAINTSAAGHVSLNDWSNPSFTDGTSDTEAYGYNAAFEVTEQIVGEVGDERMRAIFDAIAHRTIAYVGDLAPQTVSGTTDWRRFLDLVEEVGGSQKAQDLMRRYVVSDADSILLDTRRAARSAYRELKDAGGSWAPPNAVRQAMAAWDFQRATRAMSQATDVLAQRNTLDSETGQLGINYPAHFEADFESEEGDFTKLSDALQDEIGTARQLGAAVDSIARDDGFLGGIGLWGTHLADDVAAAKEAFTTGDDTVARAAAKGVIDTVANASSIGAQRVLRATGALLLVILVGAAFLLAARRRRRRVAPIETVEPPQEL